MKLYLINILARIFFSITQSKVYQDKVQWKKNTEFGNLKKSFKSFGENSILPDLKRIIGAENVIIGKNLIALNNLRIETFSKYYDEKHFPELVIGDNVHLNTDCHIGCINKVVIGNNVLMASRVYISDHSHGEITKEHLNMPPAKRPLISKGPVIVEDNVWIGEGVCILPNVIIGKNSIIGANSVVTKNVPANSIVVGIPAKVIKQL